MGGNDGIDRYGDTPTDPCTVAVSYTHLDVYKRQALCYVKEED